MGGGGGRAEGVILYGGGGGRGGGGGGVVKAREKNESAALPELSPHSRRTTDVYYVCFVRSVPSGNYTTVHLGLFESVCVCVAAVLTMSILR